MYTIGQNFQEALRTLRAFVDDTQQAVLIEQAARIMVQSVQQGGKILSCGNGGSMSDAMHFAEELTGRFRDDRPPVAAMAISDPTHITCTANDYGFGQIFSRYIQALGQADDVLLAISTSGNSENVVEAAKMAKNKELSVIALTGKSGGALAKLADVEIRVPSTRYSDRTQEIHILVIHTLIDCIEHMLNETIAT